MILAVSLLREDYISLGVRASQLGYRSEAAFSRAFKRTTGRSPGRLWREQLFSAPLTPEHAAR